MNKKLDGKIRKIIEKLPDSIKNFSYRKGPDLYFYRKLMTLRRQKSLGNLLNDKSDRFAELIYATLVSWDMNSRGAKMKYFDDFKSSILRNKDLFNRLSDLKLSEIPEPEFEEIKKIIEEIYDNLNLMKTKGKLVSNSKVMHFILPDLVMPMDRQNTLRFFFENTNESKNKFLDIFECTYQIAKKVDLDRFLDQKWNLSITKIIDNVIISFMSPKYNIQNQTHPKSLEKQTLNTSRSLNSNMKYYIYENWVAEKKAVIHRSDCGFCQNGQGIHENPLGEKNGKWHGPFDSYQEARAEANKLNSLKGRDVRSCNICKPEEG